MDAANDNNELIRRLEAKLDDLDSFAESLTQSVKSQEVS